MHAPEAKALRDAAAAEAAAAAADEGNVAAPQAGELPWRRGASSSSTSPAASVQADRPQAKAKIATQE